MTTATSTTEASAHSRTPERKNGALYYHFSDGSDAIQAVSDLRAQGLAAVASMTSVTDYLVYARLAR